MQRGLDGRRIALFSDLKDGGANTPAEAVRRALEGAGAKVQLLSASATEEDWHGAKYAALVLVDGDGSSSQNDPRILQLVREFLVSDKPLAAFGAAVRAVFEAGGVQGRSVAASGDLKAAIEKGGATCVKEDMHADGALITARSEVGIDGFASRLVRELANRFEEGALDEMSELSFPASDPPAVSPASIGHLNQEEDTRAEG